MSNKNAKKTKILFVCTGNICRSPAAEGIFRALTEREGVSQHFEVDSAGTHSYHVGERPDPRARKATKSRGVDISGLRGRKVAFHDFEDFDLILGMDRSHVRILERQCPKKSANKIRAFLSFDPSSGIRDVPDPYYGSAADFEHMIDLVEKGSQDLLDFLNSQNHLS